jgi:hypothetical protein
MKMFEVTIRATLTKTYLVESDNIESAIEDAHNYFSVIPDNAPEKYEQETIDVLERETI